MSFFQPLCVMKLKTSKFKVLAFCCQWRYHYQIQITRSLYHKNQIMLAMSLASLDFSILFSILDFSILSCHSWPMVLQWARRHIYICIMQSPPSLIPSLQSILHHKKAKLPKHLQQSVGSLSDAQTTRFSNSNDRLGICLLKSTANSAQVWWKWAGLAVLFSRQILNKLLEFKILVVRALDKLSK